ncbi:MAG: hypothetical protein K0S85_98 [Pseudomonas orientalis]|nr:hypothetical protein [Pseudomonas orientalis]
MLTGQNLARKVAPLKRAMEHEDEMTSYFFHYVTKTNLRDFLRFTTYTEAEARAMYAAAVTGRSDITLLKVTNH